jgi:hypothetical protein
MPPTSEVTLPDPLPWRFTPSRNCLSVNVAVTVVAITIGSLQTLVPVQPPPLHPAKFSS